MTASTLILLGALLLVVARWVSELVLSRLNDRCVQAHADRVPAPFAAFIEPATYARSVEYTLARSRFGRIADTWQLIILLLFLFTGLAGAAYARWLAFAGDGVGSQAAFVFLASLVSAALNLPMDWQAQFGLEQRFGFNTSTPATWWIDRFKALALALLLGYPLLMLVLGLIQRVGDAWWFWTWLLLVGWQILMAVLAPIVILPLFNKFNPLPDGPLKTRLLELARRTGFQARGLFVMDGSRRSAHSNAFFTGFGRFRRIVLFDTLITQLTEPQLAAVLAHEIGHYRRRHIPRLLAASSAGLLLGLWIVALLARQPAVYAAFGFTGTHPAVVLLLALLLGGAVGFWIAPLTHAWSRRFEYEADAFAANAMGEPDSLIGALRRLSEKNLSNLTPHPFYSRVYYSHPTLLERENALRSSSR